MEEYAKTDEKGFLRDNGKYILLARRGTTITDIWKLENADIRFNERTRGWVVVSDNNPTFFVAGDVEIWSIKEKDEPLWEKYKPYHQIDAPENQGKFSLSDEELKAKQKKSFFRVPFKIQTPFKWNW